MQPLAGLSRLGRVCSRLKVDISASRIQLLRDGLLAVLIYVVSQLLIWGVDSVINLTHRDFPGPIVAMILVWLVMVLLGLCWKGLDPIFQRWLKGPADLLNKHMSIGFTIPLIMIAKQPSTGGRDVGLVAALFLITGTLNLVFVYISAWAVQTLLSKFSIDAVTRWRGAMARLRAENRWYVLQVIFARRASAPSLCFSSSDTLANSGNEQESGSDNKEESTSTTAASQSEKAGNWAKLRALAGANPVFCLCVVLIPTVGVPVYLAKKQDTPLDTLILFTLWLGFQIAQGGVKRSKGLQNRQKLRALFASSLNTVLWTALAMIAYAAVKSAVRHNSFSDNLAALQSNITVSDLLSRNTNTNVMGSSSNAANVSAATSAATPKTVIGAGDIALSILDAGLVAWGLKLYECRRQLLSRCGLTVALVGALFAVGNVCAGPLLAAATGLHPGGLDLSFAARSVTLALAAPAMSALGGDAGLNAAMVVASGVLFQMAMGAGAGIWLARICTTFARWRTEIACRLRSGRRAERRGVKMLLCRLGGALGRGAGKADKSIGARQPEKDLEAQEACEGSSSHGITSDARVSRGDEAAPAESAPAVAASAATESDSPQTIAAGITVGINAAAMGTAYMYEQGSRAAPYSALAMTTFGVATVILANVMSPWLVAKVAS